MTLKYLYKKLYIKYFFQGETMRLKAITIKTVKLFILSTLFWSLSGVYTIDSGYSNKGYTIAKKDKKKDKKKDSKKKNKKKDKKKDSKKTSKKQPASTEKASAPVTLYGGSVDGIPIQMFLQKNGKELTGFYFYHWARPLILRGEVSDDNTFFLDEYVGTEILNAFDGKIDGNTLSGRYGGYTSFEITEIKQFSGSTKVASDTTYNNLMGEHLLSLHWISWDHYGNVAVVKIGDKVFLYGQQFNYRGDTLVVSGMVTEINESTFTINGLVSTQVRGIADGEKCNREGTLTFSLYPGGEYWRLKEMDNPCDSAADYVDIFFKRPANRYYNENLYILGN